jgi:hypothetical protein
LPAIRENGANARDAAAATSEDVFETRARLLEQTLVLDRLAEHDAEHRAMTRVSHGGHAVAPPGNERAEKLRVSGQNIPIDRDLALLSSW